MITKGVGDFSTNEDLTLSFVIQFLESKRKSLLTDMILQGIGEGNVDHRPWQVESINRALAILKTENNSIDNKRRGGRMKLRKPGI